MKEVERYFKAEWNESIVGLLLSAGLLGFGAYFFTQDGVFGQGIAYVFMVTGVVLLAICSTIFMRTPKDIARVTKFLLTQQDSIADIEIPRMEKVMEDFERYRYIEVALVAAGYLIHFFAARGTMFSGVGSGLLFVGPFLLIFDFFAEHRGRNYLTFLKNTVNMK